MCLATAAWGVSVTINSPHSGMQYKLGATVFGSGAFSWANNEPSVDIIELYTLTDSANPLIGTIISSSGANVSKTSNPDGSGSGTFQSSSTNPPLARSNSGQFYFTAVRGWYMTNGVPYYKFELLTAAP